MWSLARIVAACGVISFASGTQIAAAQVGTPPAEAGQHGAGTGELNHQDSNMGSGSGNTGGANNGVGTQGSLDHDAGKASSTVAGVKGGTTSFGGGESSKATGQKLESDPSQGGGKQHQ